MNSIWWLIKNTCWNYFCFEWFRKSKYHPITFITLYLRIIIEFQLTISLTKLKPIYVCFLFSFYCRRRYNLVSLLLWGCLCLTSAWELLIQLIDKKFMWTAISYSICKIFLETSILNFTSKCYYLSIPDNSYYVSDNLLKKVVHRIKMLTLLRFLGVMENMVWFAKVCPRIFVNKFWIHKLV